MVEFGDWAQWVGNAVSLIAVYLAVRSTNRANSLSERILAIEQAREHDRIRQSRGARLIAYRTEDGRRLRITNQGQAGAREITVTIDGVPLPDHESVAKQNWEEYNLPAGAWNDHLLHRTQLEKPRAVSIRWTDDTGSNTDTYSIRW